jgi:hypothetical protein
MTRAATLAVLAGLTAGACLAPAASPPPTPAPATAEAAPRASLADLAWLAGRWVGEGLDGIAEEVWLPESGGAMLGSFRSIKGGQVVFYEILTLAPNTSGQLELRLKHFHPDLKGWEERDQVQAWALTRVEGEAFAFGPIVFRREGTETLVVTVTMKLGDGSRKDEVFRFRRAR